jgi:outer membrane protein
MFSVAAFAQEPMKIGVINVQEILKKSDPGQQATEQMREQFQGKKQELDEQKSEIEQMRQDLQKQSLVLSQQAKLDKELEFKRKVRDFQDSMENFQRQAKVEEGRLSKPIIETIVKVVNDYGEKNGYDLILDGTAAGVMYVNEPVNLTNQVIVEVNKAWREKEKAN